MPSERRRYRLLSSLGAFSAAVAPISGFYLGIVAGLSVEWWLGATLALGVFTGFLYSRREYSLPRLWKFARVVWSGLVVVLVAVAVVFPLRLGDFRALDFSGRAFVGGLAFVVFAVVYAISYQRAYTEPA